MQPLDSDCKNKGTFAVRLFTYDVIIRWNLTLL